MQICFLNLHTTPVLFFSERNRPVGPCPICLVSLEKEFCKTPCFHYFHSYCLGKALESQSEEKEEGKPFICPVCRESLGSSMDVEKLLLAPGLVTEFIFLCTFWSWEIIWLKVCWVRPWILPGPSIHVYMHEMKKHPLNQSVLLVVSPFPNLAALLLHGSYNIQPYPYIQLLI